jgi:hypothetical protein
MISGRADHWEDAPAARQIQRTESIKSDAIGLHHHYARA